MTILKGYQPAHVVRYFRKYVRFRIPLTMSRHCVRISAAARSGTAIAMWRMLRET